MQVIAYRTDIITSGSATLFQLLDTSLPQLADGSVVAISAKVVALCEGRTVPVAGTDKDTLIAQESQYYLPRSTSPYAFTITRGMLVPAAGIDESNGNNEYVLWPADPQAAANAARRHLCQRFGIQNVGVILTDSIVYPLQWGVTGMAVAASGFRMIQDEIGRPDLFGRPLRVTKQSVQAGLAAAAVLVMGEAAQQTPLAVITDVPFVTFTGRDPSAAERASLAIDPAQDLYAPFLAAVPWQQGNA